MIRLIFPFLLGVAGLAVLLSLGLWQVQRLALKEATLAAISARIADAPVAVPAAPDQARDIYLPVVMTGLPDARALYVLTSQDGVPGYRVIAGFDSGPRRVMADLGFVRIEDKARALPNGEVTLRGNLHWPDEADGWTPPPDGDIWFARDVPAMAAALVAEPVLVVAAEISPAIRGLTPLPIDTAAIPNDHLGYAVTWFALALVWAVMSGIFAYRMAGRTQRTI